MSKSVAAIPVTAILVALSVIVPSLPCGAATAAPWTCQAESASGTSPGSGDLRQDAEDAALANCAAKSARFSTCKIIACRRTRHWL